MLCSAQSHPSDPTFAPVPRRSGHVWAARTPGLAPYLGCPHTWAACTPGLVAHLGWPHAWAGHTPGLPAHLGCPHAWAGRTPGLATHLGWPHTWAARTPWVPARPGCPHPAPDGEQAAADGSRHPAAPARSIRQTPAFGDGAGEGVSRPAAQRGRSTRQRTPGKGTARGCTRLRPF